MKQSKKHSLVESLTNVILGYFINIGAQMIIFPLFNMDVTITQNFMIGAIFLGISLTRSYIIRRFFTKRTEWQI